MTNRKAPADEITALDAGLLLEKWLEQPPDIDTLSIPLADDVASELVAGLKAEVDRHWWIDAQRSVELAQIIIQIGEARGDLSQIALGRMARGDSYNMLGQKERAWQELEEAAQLFLDAGDEVGWARTRIGRVLLCIELNVVSEALADVEPARAVFLRYEELELLIRLLGNAGLVNRDLGEHQQAQAFFEAALATALELGEAGEKYLPGLYLFNGLCQEDIADFRSAQASYEQSRQISLHQNQTKNALLAQINLANINRFRGQYRQAVQGLHEVVEQSGDTFPDEMATAQLNMLACYLELNRFEEARQIARQLVNTYTAVGAGFRRAYSQAFWGVAEAQLGYFNDAQIALTEAAHHFREMGAGAWLAITNLWRGQIARQQDDLVQAQAYATAAHEYFFTAAQQHYLGQTILLRGQIALAQGQTSMAQEAGCAVLQIAKQANLLMLRRDAYMLLGRVYETEGRVHRALHYYQAAVAALGRLQRRLTITLRTDFLQNKHEAAQVLIRLYLQAGETARALEMVEHTKAQVLLGYLANREHLRWSGSDPRTIDLLENLEALRAEHHRLYQQIHLPTETTEVAAGDERLTELEKAIRQVTEQLYLLNENAGFDAGILPGLADIQAGLEADSLLIEFYNDGRQVYVFTVTRDDVSVHALATDVSMIDKLLNQLQFNIDCALNTPPTAPANRPLTKVAQRILGRLYDVLLAPIAEEFREKKRLVIVPYGSLHYLPFSALFDGASYLIEQHEVVILPTAALLANLSQQTEGDTVRVLAHSWDGRLPQSIAEAQIVRDLFDGDLYTEADVRHDVLSERGGGILHIATHGEYRMDQPEFSYLEFDDGQVFSDDLFQHDLRYQLVTLSACETGRANITPGDELIGLGRGFMIAGADSLVASLWRVDDALTVGWMEIFYQTLKQGASRAKALQVAQTTLAEQEDLHPAFWTAFQLIGDAGPLRL